METLRESPSGPDINVQSPITSFSGLTGTAPAFVAAGDAAYMTVNLPSAKIGDTALLLSGTLFAAGIITGNALCLANGVLTVPLTATKAYAGAALNDINAVLISL